MANDPLASDFITHVPAWRVRRLRELLRQVQAEGRLGVAGAEDEHRALKRVRSAARAAVAQDAARSPRLKATRAAKLAAKVEAGRRGPLLHAIADRHFDGSEPPRGAIQAAYREVTATLRAGGMSAPKFHRWRVWLSYMGRVPWPRSQAHLASGD
jgi:hypothetical protein